MTINNFVHIKQNFHFIVNTCFKKLQLNKQLYREIIYISKTLLQNKKNCEQGDVQKSKSVFIPIFISLLFMFDFISYYTTY